MKRMYLAGAVFFLGALAVSPAAWAGASAHVDQTGDYNYTKVIQKGDKTRVAARRIGQYEYLSVAARTELQANRLGKSNLRQALKCGAIAPADSAAYVAQSGVGNRAGINQAGFGNTAVVSQDGVGNASYTVQTGSNLHATTRQSGDYNVALVVQRC